MTQKQNPPLKKIVKMAKKEDFTSFLKFLIIPDMLCISVSVFPNIYIWGKNWKKKFEKKKFEKKNLKFKFFFRQIGFYWLSVGFQNRKCSLFNFRFYQNAHTKVIDWLTELESHSESAKIQKSSSNRRKIAISQDFWQ